MKPFKIVEGLSKTNIFVSYCEEEEKQKKEASIFIGTKLRTMNIIVPRRFAIATCAYSPKIFNNEANYFFSNKQCKQ